MEKNPKAPNRAKRIDVNPLAVPMFTDAEVVYFCIEGAIKADSILTAGGGVFSVPSVTLWDADELEQFARANLIGKRIVIVPDADWNTNPAVITQATLCQGFFRDLGIVACVAAPPIELYEATKDSKNAIKGVDDFLAPVALGGAGGCLEELEVVGREAPTLEHWIALQDGRKDRIENDCKVLRRLARHAGTDGSVYVPYRTLLRLTGLKSTKTIGQIIERLAEAGAIVIEGSPETQRGTWRGGFRDPALDYIDRPTYIVRDDLRATFIPAQRLADWLAG